MSTLPATKPTIAILHYAGPPTVGGVEQTIAAHARLLADSGHPVRIISGMGAFDGPGVTVLSNPALGSRGPRVEQVARELAAGQAGPAFAALADELAGWLAPALENCGALLAHNVLSLHKNLALTAALQRLHAAGRLPRLLAWCHDFAWRDPLYQAELHPGFPWDLLRRPWPGARYVAVSHDRRAQLDELLGLSEREIAVAPPGVDLAEFLKLEPATVALCERLALLEAEPLLLLPARITRRKNIELAIRIVGALGRQGLRPRLVVTGPPGPHNPANAAYLAELQTICADEGATDAVVFLYEHQRDAQARPVPASDAQLADLYRLADGLLFPSAYEGFGIPIIEAGLSGIPIFCSDIAPFREVAGAAALRFGLSEPPDQIGARIAAALRADPRAELRRRVRTEYSWQAIGRRVLAPLLQHG